MKYSIILPVRNGGEYVKECVQSILNQTFPDFNLIILDSGSTDGTISYLQSLEDSRIALFLSERPLTIEENWSRIMHIRKNEFITLIGHDDILLPEYLATIDELIITYPEASLYQTHFNFIDKFGNNKGVCKPMPSLMHPHEFVAKALKLEIDLNGTGFVCRASQYEQIGGIPLYPNLMFSDYALWFSLAATGPVVTSDSFQFSYRIHQNTSQVANVIVYKKALNSFVDFLKSKRNEAIYRQSIQKFSSKFIAHYCKSISHKMLRVGLEKRNGVKVIDFVEECNNYCKELSGSYDHSFLPKDFSLKLAIIIDSNAFSRFLFKEFKRLYKKPIL